MEHPGDVICEDGDGMIVLRGNLNSTAEPREVKLLNVPIEAKQDGLSIIALCGSDVRFTTDRRANDHAVAVLTDDIAWMLHDAATEDRHVDSAGPHGSGQAKLSS